MYNQALPIILQSVFVIVFILFAMLIVKMIPIASKAYHTMLAKLPIQEQAILEAYAKEAYHFAENMHGRLMGARKLETAAGYVSGRLARKGIELPPDVIIGAIQKAWYEAEGYLKTQSRVYAQIAADQETARQLEGRQQPTDISQVNVPEQAKQE